MSIVIREIDASEAAIVATLANEIWHEHFTPILGTAQVVYMLEKFQSPEQIAIDICENGYRYFLAEDTSVDKPKPIGYCGAYLKQDCLLLSKIYILSAYRGQGIAHHFLDTLTLWANEQGKDKIQLVCNKNNAHSLAAYMQLGFVTVDTSFVDIGGGFAMDDYILELSL